MSPEPNFFCCPVTLLLLENPVTVFPEGHTFEAEVIRRLPKVRNGKCRNPLTRRLFDPVRETAPNLALRDCITAWKRSTNIFEAKHEEVKHEEVKHEEAKQEEAKHTPNLFVKLRIFQNNVTFEEFEVLRVFDDYGNIHFVITNSPYTGANSPEPKVVNESGRSSLGYLKHISQTNIRDYIRTLGNVSTSMRSPCFRLFWLIFVCRFQYPEQLNPHTLTIHRNGTVFTSDLISVNTRTSINQLFV